MVRIQLFLLKGQVASNEFLTNAEHLKDVPKEKIVDFIKWVVKFRVNQEAYIDAQWEKLRETFDFRSIEELNGAQKCATRLFYGGCEITRSEFISDLTTLGFEKEVTELIINRLESEWSEYEDFLDRIRLEAIPVVTSINWRVDIRSGSSNYLKKAEVVALLRIGTDDGTQRNQIYVELNKDDLSWLETEIGKMKREFLKTEEKHSQMA